MSEITKFSKERFRMKRKLSAETKSEKKLKGEICQRKKESLYFKGH